MTKFRPCIDLHEGKVKQIVGSTLSENKAQTNFISEKSPSFYAKLYKTYNLKGGHIIMLGPKNEDACANALKIYPMQVGGGINIINCEKWLKLGATKIIVTSCLFEGAKFSESKLKDISELIGIDKLVVDLSCKYVQDNFHVCTNKWQTTTDLIISRDSIKRIESYCSELLIHAIDVEGKQSGIDEKLLSVLTDFCEKPCTYAGGAKSIKDLDFVNNLTKGRVDVTIGSALDIFGGNIPVEDCVKWNAKNSGL
eukprot:NODE_290_length_10614_cov_1.553590.p7 type:complete len:253 gc:universal NODE_290_length_10614_cov_1.553590:9008-9766(+)